MEPLSTVGKTTDGREVVGGVFQLFDTAGIPLEDVFKKLNDNGYVVAWDCFCADAIAAGWGKKTILSRLSEALFESHGKEYRDVVCGNLAKLI